jgi:hypothetical protein
MMIGGSVMLINHTKLVSVCLAERPADEKRRNAT